VRRRDVDGDCPADAGSRLGFAVAKLVAAITVLRVAVVALLVAGDDSIAAPAGRWPRPTERAVGGQTALGGAPARWATVTLLTRIEHAVATQ
jgi:hypothetical protein